MTDATGPRRSSPLAEFAAAVIFLTRIPIPWNKEWPADLDSRALAWFPIVGCLIGAAGGALYWALAQVGLPALPAALVTVGALIWLTGALHEDGLADVADGFGGGRDRAAKLEIMKDSRVGTYGAAALLLSVLARVMALAAIGAPREAALALIGAHAYSRGLLPAVKLLLPSARPGGTADRTGKPNSARALSAFIVGLSLAATAIGEMNLGSGMAGASILAISGCGVALLAHIARRQVGGVTGDVLGAGQQVAEALFLLAALAALRNAGIVPTP
ncbi:MAG TPA: adenosylcobinamide-GDP ribazoletransferase [Azospirillaceae bacterium]|nr:adenosylcobinamide-GDP ribazoletransferase [Azospirillaceae bacterium]